LVIHQSFKSLFTASTSLFITGSSYYPITNWVAYVQTISSDIAREY
jgi:hypothetical protein